jgi:hypothetical protein
LNELIDFESKRHQLYEDYVNLFKNKPEEVFLNRVPDPGKAIVYLALAIPREIPLLYSDLAFRNNINALIKNNVQANNAVDRLIHENGFDVLLSESSLDCSIKGGIVLKNYLDNGQSKITYVQPEYYFPEFSKFDKKKVIRETIAHVYEEDKQQYIYREIYEPRNNGEYWVINKINRYKNGKILDEISSEEQNIKIKESPLTYIPYFRANGEYWGYSIYDGLLPLFDELNWRVSQISKILDKHSDPNMYADSSFFDENKQLPSGGKAYPVDSKNGEKPPGYVTFDGSLEANYKYIREILFDILYIVSPIKPSLYGIDKAATQASARAVKIKSWRTECMVDRSLLYWKHAIKKVLYLAQQLEIVSGKGKYTPEIPNVEIYVSLPKDQYEDSQAEQLKAQEGLTSKKSAIARLNPHLTSLEVEEEWLEILNEQAEVNNQTFTKGEEVDA